MWCEAIAQAGGVGLDWGEDYLQIVTLRKTVTGAKRTTHVVEGLGHIFWVCRLNELLQMYPVISTDEVKASQKRDCNPYLLGLSRNEIFGERGGTRRGYQ